MITILGERVVYFPLIIIKYFDAFELILYHDFFEFLLTLVQHFIIRVQQIKKGSSEDMWSLVNNRLKWWITLIEWIWDFK